jgi:hypothetical protein
VPGDLVCPAPASRRSGFAQGQPARSGFVPRNPSRNRGTARLGQFLFNKDTHLESSRGLRLTLGAPQRFPPARVPTLRIYHPANLLGPHARVSARTAGRRYNGHRTGLRRRGLDVGIDVGRTQDPVGLLQFFAQGLIAGPPWLRSLPARPQSLIIGARLRIVRPRDAALRRSARWQLFVLRGTRLHAQQQQQSSGA